MRATLPIDVIVPAYNAAPLLAASLGSIARQTRGVSEIIVVDDGSTDDTAAVARSLGARVVSGPNRGVAEARNIGVRASRAPAIAFLDADDRWYPERLEAQWAVREARPSVLLIASDYALWDGVSTGGGTIANHPIFPHVPRAPAASDAFVVSRHDLLRAIVRRNFVLPSSMLVDRRIFDEFGLYFTVRESFPDDDAVFIGEDFEWLLRVLRVTDVAFVDRVLVDYRMIHGSLSARRGRIRHGDAVLGKLVVAAPDVYADGAAVHFVRERPLMLREAAIAHLRAREIPLGTARLRDYAATQPRAKAIAFRIVAAIVSFGPLRPLMSHVVSASKPRWLRALQNRS